MHNRRRELHKQVKEVYSLTHTLKVQLTQLRYNRALRGYTPLCMDTTRYSSLDRDPL